MNNQQLEAILSVKKSLVGENDDFTAEIQLLVQILEELKLLRHELSEFRQDQKTIGQFKALG